MQKQPLLSIIIPIYNVEKYLSKCLDSLIHQTYKNLEIICVNDGSTDRSAQIIKNYALKDKRIKFVTQTNAGQSVARNTGLKIAKGKYITFVDSDDYLNLETYSLCMNLFDLNIDAVLFSINVISNPDAIKWDSDDYYYQVHQKNLIKVSPQILFNENVSPCNKIYKMDIIRKNNLQFPEGLIYEDAEFYWKYMSFVKKVYFIQNPLYNYVRRSNSTMYLTFLGSDKAIDHLKIIDNLFTFWLRKKRFNIFINSIGAQLFEQYFWFSYNHSTIVSKDKVLQLAKIICIKYKLLNLYPNNIFINDLINNKLYKYKNINEYTFLQKIFSIKKFTYEKKIYLLGFNWNLKRKKYKQISSILEKNNNEKNNN